MFSSARARSIAGAVALFCGAGLWFAGCASSDGPPRGGRRGPPALQPPLAGSTAVLDGALRIEARLEPFLKNPPRATSAGDAGDDERPRRRSGSGFNMSGGGGGMQFGGGGPGGGGGGRPPGGGGPGGDEGPGGDGPREPRGGGGPGAMGLPRQTLRLTFTNGGPTSLDLKITELRSVLGNFAPRPERLKLAPGESVALDPVSGDAGGTLEVVDVVVSILRGDDTVSQTIHLAPTGEKPAGPPRERNER